MYSKSVKSAFFLIVVSASLPAWGAPKKAPSSSGESEGKSRTRDFYFGLPVVAERTQLRPHLELNLANEATVAIEAGIIGETEELSAKEQEETGNSMKVKGAQASLLISRYSEPNKMGGFFWTLGAGYRQYTAEMKKKPSAEEQQNSSLRLTTADEQGYLHHRIEGRGTTGHGRFGYRYVADQWPIALGIHVGVRHTSSTIKDSEVDEEEQKELELQYSPVSAEEKKSIANQMMTSPDFAIEFGMIF